MTQYYLLIANQICRVLYINNSKILYISQLKLLKVCNIFLYLVEKYSIESHGFSILFYTHLVVVMKWGMELLPGGTYSTGYLFEETMVYTFFIYSSNGG